jgi:hypothetical protein
VSDISNKAIFRIFTDVIVSQTSLILENRCSSAIKVIENK